MFGCPIDLSAEMAVSLGSFFLPVNVAFFSVAGFVYLTCSSSHVLSEELLRCFFVLLCLSPCLRL